METAEVEPPEGELDSSTPAKMDSKEAMEVRVGGDATHAHRAIFRRVIKYLHSSTFIHPFLNFSSAKNKVDENAHPTCPPRVHTYTHTSSTGVVTVGRR